MRPTALIPALCCTAALVLAFLCLFAGHKKDFMEDYHLITLNTSRIGYNLLNSSEEGSNPISDLFHDITNEVAEEVNERVGDMAERLGVDDFYSLHLMDFCYGNYTPTPLPNATVDRDEIHKEVTACSNRSATFHFDPTKIIEQRLNESGVDVTLEDLNWPDDIQKGIDALKIVQRAAFILYCISIAFIAFSLFLSLPAVLANGRLIPCLNIMLASLAFLAIGLASALVTALIVKGSDVINKYGNDIGVEAHKGSKFLALTWAATGLMLVALLLWCFETCIGGKRRSRAREYDVPKHG